MIRQFIPTRGLHSLHWTDQAMTAGRGLGLLVLLYLGTRLGWAMVGPAWFSTGWPGRTLGATVGILVALLVWVLMDTAAWTSGMRQERFEADRAEWRAKQKAAQEALPPAPARPAVPPARRAPAGNGRGPDGRAAAAAPGRQQQAARSAGPNGSPAAAAATVVDTRSRLIDPALADAIVRVVVACRHQGATVDDVGDRLPAVGFDPTREEVMSHLSHLTSAAGGFRLTAVRPSPFHYFDPAQLRVTDELQLQTLQVIAAAGTDPIDVDAVTAGLQRIGVQPAAPLLARVLRIMCTEGVIVEAFGGYVRSGL